MLKAALINGIIWTTILFILFYFLNKPITLTYFAIIFVVFSLLGAVKFYVRSKKKEKE
jgi:hypothetical protein